jgi:hypothetical protein
MKQAEATWSTRGGPGAAFGERLRSSIRTVTTARARSIEDLPSLMPSA